MAKMRAMVVHKAGGPLVAEERDIPVPGREEMRIRVQACGVCHSDSLTVEGLMPGIEYPRVPGHEVIGVDRRDRRGRPGLERRRARRRRLVRRLVRLLRPLPARQRLRLRECTSRHRRDPRRRLRHPCDRPCLRGRACAGRSRRNRIGPAALRRHHDLQRSSPQRRRTRRSRRGPRRRRASGTWASSSRRGRASAPSRSIAAATRRNWRESSAPATISTAPQKTRPRR